MARIGKDSNGRTLYSTIVQTPSAKVLEIVSFSTPSSHHISKFVGWKDDECPASHVRSVSSFVTAGAEEDDMATFFGSTMSSLTAIGVNIAATAATVAQIGPWLEKYKISGSASTTGKDGSCTFATITYANAEVKYVSNPSAHVGSKTVADYEEYQMSVHKKYVGQNTGWDAFMDNHWCVGVDHSKYLDATAKLWAVDGVSWHGHKTPRVSSVRSVGLNGESIELNGLIDGSYLKDLKGFDFCTADTDPSRRSLRRL